jgi:hypothetical protein
MLLTMPTFCRSAYTTTKHFIVKKEKKHSEDVERCKKNRQYIRERN